MTGRRSDEEGRPDVAGDYCGHCGTDAWSVTEYKCPGCGRRIPAAAVHPAVAARYKAALDEGYACALGGESLEDAPAYTDAGQLDNWIRGFRAGLGWTQHGPGVTS